MRLTGPSTCAGREDPERLDFIAFSGHKTYAPYGAGILAGDKSMLCASEPALVGGGVADLVTPHSVVWRDLPSREEAGTPAVAGAVAIAASIDLLGAVGWDAIMQHEAELTRYALTRLSRIPGIKVHGKTSTDTFDDRLGTICFSMDGKPAQLVAAVLAYEAGVGARCGQFCAHPYIFALLGISDAEAERLYEGASCGNLADMPGVVRASFGLYNNESDVDALCDCLEAIAKGNHAEYDTNPNTGERRPKGQTQAESRRLLQSDSPATRVAGQLQVEHPAKTSEAGPIGPRTELALSLAQQHQLLGKRCVGLDVSSGSGKKNVISRRTSSSGLDAWTALERTDVPKSARIVPGAALLGSVTPTNSRTRRQTFSPSSRTATSGPKVMNSTSPGKELLALMDRIELLGLRLAQSPHARPVTTEAGRLQPASISPM